MLKMLLQKELPRSCERKKRKLLLKNMYPYKIISEHILLNLIANQLGEKKALTMLSNQKCFANKKE